VLSRFGTRVLIPLGNRIRTSSANLLKLFAKYLCITVSCLRQQYATWSHSAALKISNGVVAVVTLPNILGSILP